MPPASVTTATTSLHIAGRWVPAASGESLAAVDPAHGTHLGEVALGDRADAQRAVEAAAAAAPWESHLPFGGRAGSAGGLGRVGGRYSLERLTERKTIVVNLA